MKVLFICKYIPYGRNAGRAIKASALLSCLGRVCDVTCAFIVDQKQYDEEYCGSEIGIKTYYIIKKYQQNPVRRYLKHLAEILYADGKVKKELATVVEAEKPDIIWLEFGYICELVPFLKSFDCPIVYGSHNSQFKLDYDLCFKNTSLTYKLKMIPQVALCFLHERVFFKMADLTLCISQEDMKYYEKMMAPSNLRYFPMFLDDMYLATFPPKLSQHRYACMVGSLRAYQNLFAVMHTLEKIWPTVSRRDTGLFLYVIGEIPPTSSDEYKNLMSLASRTTNVIFTGYVDSAVPLIKSAAVSIAPILIGSGIRTKILESVSCQTPVVSTSLGAEGLPFTDGDSIQIADTPEEFAEKMLTVVGDDALRKKLSTNAYHIYQERFSQAAGIRSVKEIINALCNG